jgi:hypothetical protein
LEESVEHDIHCRVPEYLHRKGPSLATSILYPAVRIVETSLIAAPTTLGNNIRISPRYSLDDATLIHELTHIWQFQNRGTGYVSDSLSHQLAGILGSGDRNAAYAYAIVPGMAFDRYTAEQQAMIVEDYYRQPSKRGGSGVPNG